LCSIAIADVGVSLNFRDRVARDESLRRALIQKLERLRTDRTVGRCASNHLGDLCRRPNAGIAREIEDCLGNRLPVDLIAADGSPSLRPIKVPHHPWQRGAEFPTIYERPTDLVGVHLARNAGVSLTPSVARDRGHYPTNGSQTHSRYKMRPESNF
jgi:hypothetical protein